MIFQPGAAFALELIALTAGASLIIMCHRSPEQNAFCKFIGYFTVIFSFIALLATTIACFSYWMDGGLSHHELPKTDIRSPQQQLENKGFKQEYKARPSDDLAPDTMGNPKSSK